MTKKKKKHKQFGEVGPRRFALIIYDPNSDGLCSRFRTMGNFGSVVEAKEHLESHSIGYAAAVIYDRREQFGVLGVAQAKEQTFKEYNWSL